MEDKKVVEKYLKLIQQFIRGDQDAATFSKTFLEEFKREELEMSDEVYQPLQALFGACDAYSDDPDLRTLTSDGIGERELMETAKETQQNLRSVEMN